MKTRISSFARMSLVATLLHLAATHHAAQAQEGVRELLLEHRYLHFPVGGDTARKTVQLRVDGEVVRYFHVEIVPKGTKPRYWASLDVGAFAGKQATLTIQGDAALLDFVAQGDVPRIQADAYHEALRPQFHFSPLQGWTNDPNGLVYFEGKYHLFFQHNPFGTNWGNMTWGHAVSPDLVHWTEVGDALHPDAFGTMFSGSAVVDHNNTSGLGKGGVPPMMAYYTAAGGQALEKVPFTQCMAYSTDRGATWTKYEKNPVVEHIVGSNRDPKVFWHEPSKKWVMALYLERSKFVIMGSENGRDWKKLSDVAFPNGHECPELFELALDGDENNTRWIFWEGGGRHLIGTFDGERFTPETGVLQSEWGANCYAGQLWNDVPDGRTLFIGWMRGKTIPESKEVVFAEMPFNQQMTFPREFTLRTTPDGPRLFAQPAREIETLRGKHRRDLPMIAIISPLQPKIQGDVLDIDVSITPNSAEQVTVGVMGTHIVYDAAAKELRCLGKKVQCGLLDGRLKLRMLVDRRSLEIFINDGRYVMSFYFQADKEKLPVTMTSTGGQATFDSVDIWELASIWEKNK